MGTIILIVSKYWNFGLNVLPKVLNTGEQTFCVLFIVNLDIILIRHKKTYVFTKIIKGFSVKKNAIGFTIISMLDQQEKLIYKYSRSSSKYTAI